jgi:hypothetical protein
VRGHGLRRGPTHLPSPLPSAGSAAFRHALRIGPGPYRLAAAALALAASAVGVALSVAAQMALLTLIVAAALVVESRAVDTVEA